MIQSGNYLLGTRKQYIWNPGRKAILDDVHIAFLMKTMEECSMMTFASPKLKISQEFGIDMSLTLLQNQIIKKCCY